MIMSCEKSFDQVDDTVDPRVQVELERLNTATDEINKLEVDLDDARNQFRQLLSESTVRINNCAKKLGNCIEKARPYYDARLKAREALQETQKAAVNFERANSAHAAAKEMVYLAEEGLKTEGRTFDHAWQEMLNHATMRVNESESDRTRSESEHKRTSQIYQHAEVRVQTLQKELKRAITKSSLQIRRQLLLMNSIANQHNLLFLPYFELKIQYNQLLEHQKNRVKNLEKQVSHVKMCYADTLRNLEQISDEIHQTRQNGKLSEAKNGLGTRSDGVGAESSPGNEYGNLPKAITGSAKAAKSFQNDANTETGKLQPNREAAKILTPLSETSTKLTPNTPSSSQPDSDLWSESTDTGRTEGIGDGDSYTGSGPSENDSSLTGPPDSESDDEFFKLPDKLSSRASPHVNKNASFFPPSPEFKAIKIEKEKTSNGNGFSEGIGICSFPAETELNLTFSNNPNPISDIPPEENNSNCWTEIKLHSPEQEEFLTVKSGTVAKRKNQLEEEFDIPYAPLSEAEGDFPVSVNSLQDSPEDKKPDEGQKAKLGAWIGKSPITTPRKMNIRRQSLDLLWNNATGEKMKEILSHSIMKLSIGSLTERRSSESRIDDADTLQNDCRPENLRTNDGSSYESNLTSQFGLQFFKRNSKDEDSAPVKDLVVQEKTSIPQDTFSNHIGGFMSRKEKFFTKKVPSPLEKTLGYLNADEDSNSDSESLASMDMLTDEQLSSLVLDLDLSEVYQDIIS